MAWSQGEIKDLFTSYIDPNDKDDPDAKYDVAPKDGTDENARPDVTPGEWEAIWHYLDKAIYNEIEPELVGDAAITEVIAGTGLSGGGSSGSVTLDVATGGITTTLLAADAVTSAKIAADAVVNAAIANGAVDTAQIANDAITSAKIAADAVVNASIAIAAVDTTEIADNAITSAKIAADAVVNAAIANGAVDTAQIATNAVTGTEIDDFAVDTTHLAWYSVTVDQIATGAVTTDKLAADAVTSAKIAADAVDTAAIAAGAVNTTQLASDAVTSAKIAAGAVDTTQIATGAVTATELQNGLFDTDFATAVHNGGATISGTGYPSFASLYQNTGPFSIPADGSIEVTDAGTYAVSASIAGNADPTTNVSYEPRREFSASHNGGITISSGGSELLNYNITLVSDGGYSLTSGVVDIEFSGVYEISAMVSSIPDTGDAYVRIVPQISSDDGTTWTEFASIEATAHMPNADTPSVTTALPSFYHPLSQGDKVRVRIDCLSASGAGSVTTSNGALSLSAVDEASGDFDAEQEVSLELEKSTDAGSTWAKVGTFTGHTTVVGKDSSLSVDLPVLYESLNSGDRLRLKVSLGSGNANNVDTTSGYLSLYEFDHPG